MKQVPLLSIVMPSLNQRAFVEQAVESVLSQANVSMELVVADGLSTDGTLEFLQSLAQQDARIKVLAGKDTGPAQALNKALAAAQGPVVGWINADDFYAPHVFEQVLKAFEHNPDWLMLYGQGQHVDEAGSPIGLYPTLPPTIMVDRFQAGCFICQPTVFFKKHLWEQLGPLDESLRASFDFEYWLRVFTKHQDRVGFIDALLANSRLHANTITARNRQTVALEGMAVLKKHLGYVGPNWSKNLIHESRQHDPNTDLTGFLNKAADYLLSSDLEEVRALAGFEEVGGTLAIRQQDLPWVANLIYQCRVDLQEKFNLADEQGLFEFVAWLVRSANDVNVCLQDEPEFIQFCEKKLFKGRKLTVLEAVVYLSAQELPEQFVLPRDELAYQAWFKKTFQQAGKGGLANIAKVHVGVRPMPAGFKAMVQQGRASVANRTFGVNVIGYAYGQLGIGEDARMTARALQKLGIPFCMVNFAPGASIPQNDYSMHQYVVEEGPYSINLFCMTATETARYFCFQGGKQFYGRHNIAYWPWELNKWPTRWLPVNELIDEVWVATQHIHNALAPVCSKPVTVVPLHVELGPISPLGRADFGLPEQAKLFCFSFDLHSSVHRKNPHDCIRAFLNSFPAGRKQYSKQKVGLVIKTHRPEKHHPDWEALKSLAAQDDRIYIVENTLSRPDLLALYRCCDAFLSLHRAEGFGRGIAEAIMLGLEVITTNYSGNTDFCKPPQCTLVDYSLIPVKPHEYIEAEGMHWAGNLKLPKLSVKKQTHR